MGRLPAGPDLHQILMAGRCWPRRGLRPC